MRYKEFIEENLEIVNKSKKLVKFKLNSIQEKYLSKWTGHDVILKARQQGFSSLITAIFFCDFLLVRNSYSVVLADIEDNATGLLDKIKFLIQCYEYKNKKRVPLKYNSRYELYNPLYNSSLKIGTAKNHEFGRSKTIINLHCSEFALYPNIKKILAGCVQAVVPNGKIIFETTANGFNEFKKFWEDSKAGETGYNPFFYKASDFYTEQFLAQKRKELGALFSQEYPENDVEAFVSTGECYFDKLALSHYLAHVEPTIQQSASGQ